MELMYQKGNTAAKPNVHVYTTVINSWAKSGESSSGEHAYKLLERMEKLYEKGNKAIKPNTYTYTGKTVMQFRTFYLKMLLSVHLIDF